MCHALPIEWAEKGVSKEDQVRPYLQRLERKNQFGVYFIYRSMEIGPTFRSSTPKFPTSDPDYRILRRRRSRYTHYYFYIRDQELGPIALCVGSFLPFQINCWLNGHSFMQQQLQRQGIGFRKNDNAFLQADDPKALQEIANQLTASLIEGRLNRWIRELGPKFSLQERQSIPLQRHFSMPQVEYCRNFVFRRNFPIHKLFERSCDLSLWRLRGDKIAQVFGFRVNRRLRGKLHRVLERMEHGHHVFRAGCKKAVLRMYEKYATFLRVEVLSNHLRDFRIGKSLHNLEAVRQTLASVTDRFAVSVDFPFFQRLALPLTRGQSRIPGIQIHNTRMIRLMEVLLHSGPTLTGWSSREIYQALLQTFTLSAQQYTLTQLRYDLRKMKGHGLIERVGRQYRYRLTEKGCRTSLMFVLFHQRVCGPLAHSLFNRSPQAAFKPATQLEAAYRKADQSIERILKLLAA